LKSRPTLGGAVVLAASALLAPVFAVHEGRLRVGDVAPLALATPHPYPAGTPAEPVVWRVAIRHPGATYLTVHLERLELGPGDHLAVLDGTGKEQARLTGRGPRGDGRNFWTPAVHGDALVLELHAPGGGEPHERYGLSADRYAHGFAPLAPPAAEAGSIDSVCGSDNRRDVKCYETSHPVEYERARAVGRLLVYGSWVCTGFFVSCDGHMLTNSHCISTQDGVENTQITMMFENSACEAIDPSSDRVLTGSQLIKNWGPLDYILFTVAEDASEYGFLGFDPRLPDPGERIYMPAHHSGAVKAFGIESDREPGGVCRVTESPWTWSNDDVMYYCDTTGGSSGSPLLSGETHRVVAINHTESQNCVDGNAAVRIDKIFPQIRDLLPACSFSPDLQPEQVSVIDVAGDGNGNGVADPGETVHLKITLANRGTAPATGLSGTLSTAEPGVIVLDPVATFDDVADGASGASHNPHFRVRLDSAVGCGASIPFRLDLSTGQGAYALSLSIEAGRNDGGPRFYAAGDVPRAIPDWNGAGTTSLLDVPDSFTTADAHVRPEITHTYIGDLTVELTSPLGTAVRLHDRSGWSRDVIDHDYDRELPPDGPGAMSDLDGEDALGQWSLRVVDDQLFNSGNLDAWTLELHRPDAFVCAAAGGAGTPGEASDDRLAGAEPLRVTGYDGASGTVSVSFTPACAATDHAAYSGDLAAVAGTPWDAVACGLGASGSASFDPGAGDRFFVVVGQGGGVEGSYGRDGAGVERAEATGLGACDVAQSLAATCP
jgi:subtilisin-like proprotein convertase family protein